jgi:SsrA-binding protein
MQYNVGTMSKPTKSASASIAENRKARHDYHIEDDYEAGLCLEGWEVKSLREGQASLAESYAFIKNGEAWLTGCHITPLKTASTHINPEPRRARKLLLNRQELDRLTGAIDRKGYTLVPLSLYWKKGRAKLRVGLAKGKQQHDKRADSKDRDWKRQQARILKSNKQ